MVPAIEHVYRNYGNALDAKTGAPLFSKQTWQKANAVLELAYQGYLSAIDGVVLYEHAGVDEHGLQLWKCTCGTWWSGPLLCMACTSQLWFLFQFLNRGTCT